MISSPLLRSCHLCPIESRNHYSNGGGLAPSLPLARSNALLNPNSELFSPAGIKKRQGGIDTTSAHACGPGEDGIKLNFTIDRPRQKIRCRVSGHFGESCGASRKVVSRQRVPGTIHLTCTLPLCIKVKFPY